MCMKSFSGISTLTTIYLFSLVATAGEFSDNRFDDYRLHRLKSNECNLKRITHHQPKLYHYLIELKKKL